MRIDSPGKMVGVSLLIWFGISMFLWLAILAVMAQVKSCRERTEVAGGVVDSASVFEYGDKVMMYQGSDGETLCWVSATDDGGVGDKIEGPEPGLCLRAMVEAMQRPRCP